MSFTWVWSERMSKRSRQKIRCSGAGRFGDGPVFEALKTQAASGRPAPSHFVLYPNRFKGLQAFEWRAFHRFLRLVHEVRTTEDFYRDRSLRVFEVDAGKLLTGGNRPLAAPRGRWARSRSGRRGSSSVPCDN